MNKQKQIEDIDLTQELLKHCMNLHVYESFIVSKTKFEQYENPVISISGGADSDIVLDIVARVDIEKKSRYVFFDTGIEYQATKEHLNDLEKKYYITIERERAKTPVPVGCKKYGLPFWSKFVSEMIERLQRHGFKWEDKPFDELINEYPKCRVAIKWWCNENGENSRFNISYTRELKEYMIAYPPDFKISNKCCDGAKKSVAKEFLKNNNTDLNVVGIRKAEGGIRATAYKTCFDNGKEEQSWDNYRPIFWYEDKDKEYYEQFFEIKHSDCYHKYGLKRTGCAGCPFGKDFEKELEVCKRYEPKLYNAINYIFGKSYEYTRRFLEFRKTLSNSNEIHELTEESNGKKKDSTD